MWTGQQIRSFLSPKKQSQRLLGCRSAESSRTVIFRKTYSMLFHELLMNRLITRMNLHCLMAIWILSCLHPSMLRGQNTCMDPTSTSPSQAISSGVEIIDLRTEGVVQPLGIEETAPRFSWRYVVHEKNRRNFKQVVCRVLVASSKERYCRETPTCGILAPFIRKRPRTSVCHLHGRTRNIGNPDRRCNVRFRNGGVGSLGQ